MLLLVYTTTAAAALRTWVGLFVDETDHVHVVRGANVVTTKLKLPGYSARKICDHTI